MYLHVFVHKKAIQKHNTVPTLHGIQSLLIIIIIILVAIFSMANSSSSLVAHATASSLNLQIQNITVKLDRDNYLLRRSTIISALETFDLESFILYPTHPPACNDRHLR